MPSHNEPPKADGGSRLGDTQPNSLGTLGEYTLVRELGQGGMGQVYEAQHCRHHGRVALKRLIHVSPASVRAFREEFRSLARISHRNLIRLLELDATGGEPYFTMELIDGVNFLDFVRVGFDSQESDIPVPYHPARLAAALRQIAEGLLALHREHKLHRDIKPDNVLVTRNGRVVLVDFGLAVDMDRDANLFRNSLEQRTGTPYYMSPEQHAAESLTFSSDWYSVGVMLYKALTDQLPFEGSTLSELHAKKVAPQRPEPRQVVSHVSGPLNDLCVRLLAPAPGERADGEDILGLVGGEVTRPASRQVWVGRDEGLEQLHAALADARKRDAPTTVLVSGPPGAGKSALIDHFLESVRESGRQVVLRGRCYENESVPYKGFDMVVDALARYLHRLPLAKAEACLPRDTAALCQMFPVLHEVPAVRYFGQQTADPRVNAQELRRRGLAALCETLGRLSDRDELIIYVDDLQWGDTETALLFEQLVQPRNQVRCLTIGAYRDGEEARVSDCVRAIRSLAANQDPSREVVRRREIEVNWLSPRDAERLALELIGDNSPEALNDARVIAKESGGSPLFVNILTQHRDGEPQAHAGVRAPSEASEPLSLEQVLWQLITALPQEQRAVVELVAVAGRPVSRQLIYQASKSSDDPALLFHDSLASCLVRMVKGNQQDQIETYHDRIRETVVRRLEAPQLAVRAGQLADAVAVADEPLDSEFMAMLLNLAGRRPEAGRYYWQAADRARDQLAFAQAVDLYRNALETLQRTGEDELKLRIGLAEALAHAGRGAEAGDQYRAAAALAEGDQQRDLQCQAALRFLTSGHVDQGLSDLKQVLSAVGMPLPRTPLGAYLSSLRRRFGFRWNDLRFTPGSAQALPPSQRQMLDYAWSAAAGLSVVDPVRAGAYVSRYVALSLRAGDPKYLTRALAAQVGHIAISGGRSRGDVARFLRALHRVAEIERGPYSRACRELARGLASHLHGRWSAASKSCDRAAVYLSDPRCQDVAWELDTTRTFALWALLYQGNVAELTSRQPELLRLARESQDLFAMLNFGTVVMTLVYLGANQPDIARQRLDDERQLLSSQGFYVQHHNWVLGRTLLELFEGRAEAAWNVIANKWRDYQREHLDYVEQVRIDFHQVQGRAAVAVAACDNAAVGTQPAQRIVRRLERERAPWARAIAPLLRAGLATIRGERQLAVEQYERAVKELDAVDMHLHAAAARCRLGQLRRDPVGAEHNARGLEMMAELGVTNGEAMTRAMAPGKF